MVAIFNTYHVVTRRKGVLQLTATEITKKYFIDKTREVQAEPKAD